jgi:hypothetical protein
MKKQCEQCEKEFEYSRDAARFCSGKCRVKWNRNHPKKEVTKIEMEVLYNQMLDLVSEMKNNLAAVQPNINYVISEIAVPNNEHIMSVGKPQIKIKRSFENYQQLRIDCENEEDWVELKEEILNCEHLTQKQKTLLTN